MTPIDALLLEAEKAVAKAEENLRDSKAKLALLRASPDANTYESHDEAESVLYERLHGFASDDCEGSYNCGSPKYEQRYYVGGKAFLATMTFDYDRHDKTYYYVDGCNYSFTECTE